MCHNNKSFHYNISSKSMHSQKSFGGCNQIQLITLPTAEILSGKNGGAFLVCGFWMKSFKRNMYPENTKKIVGAIWNPAHFHPNWAGFKGQLIPECLRFLKFSKKKQQ